MGNAKEFIKALNKQIKKSIKKGYEPIISVTNETRQTYGGIFIETELTGTVTATITFYIKPKK